MKPRRRYIAFEVEGSKAGGGELWRAIEHSLRVNSPKIDRTMLKLALYEKSSQRGLFRCGHKQVDEVKAAISSVGKIGGRKASLRIFGVSGTIKAAKRKFLALPRAKS